MGGTLYQITEDQKSGTLIKHIQSAPVWYATHEVKLDAGSGINRIMGHDNIRVNSFHHQAVKDLAGTFRATGGAVTG